MKTYEQLMTHYWGIIVPMADAAGINPWECVRHDKHVSFTDHPDFKDGKVDGFEFALTVREGRPIFLGTTVYHKEHGWCEIVGILNRTEVCDRLFPLTPPTKKRTFMLELTEEKLALLIKIPIEQRLFDDPLMFELLKDLQDLNATRSNQNANSVFRQSEQ